MTLTSTSFCLLSKQREAKLAHIVTQASIAYHSFLCVNVVTTILHSHMQHAEVSLIIILLKPAGKFSIFS